MTKYKEQTASSGLTPYTAPAVAFQSVKTLGHSETLLSEKCLACPNVLR